MRWAGVFAAIAALIYWRSGWVLSQRVLVLGGIAAFWGLLGLAAPRVFTPVYHGWMWLAFVLNFVMTRVILSVLLFLA